MNHACTTTITTRDSSHKNFLSSLNRSEGSQRASRGDKSLIIRVNGYRSVLNAYDAGKEAETFLSSLNKSERFSAGITWR
jgi:hypothetical protein